MPTQTPPQKLRNFCLTPHKKRKDQRMPMHTTPQKRLFQTPSEILVHRGVCILNGMAQVLRTDLNTDQNFLLLDFNKAGMDSKNCFRLLVMTYFVTRHNSRYFSQSLEHNLRLAFRRNQFFRLSRCFTSPSIIPIETR